MVTWIASFLIDPRNTVVAKRGSLGSFGDMHGGNLLGLVDRRRDIPGAGWRFPMRCASISAS